MDHADAYKSALTLNDIIEQASPNEQSWILQDIAQLPFARTACETGFNAGHHAFHMLTANYDLVVHSFEVCLSASFTSLLCVANLSLVISCSCCHINPLKGRDVSWLHFAIHV